MPASPGGTGTAPAAEADIHIDTIEAGNPLVVHGRARTFENNVVLRARDAEGAIITETFTTARGEMGSHNPFMGSLWITRDPGSVVVVEALEYSAKDGSERSLVRTREPFRVRAIEAELHFANEGCTGVRPFRRSLPASPAMARLLLEALIAGPTPAEKAKGANGSFPDGARVDSVALRGGVLTVDFNERLQNVGGACRAGMIRDSVTQTLQSLPTVERVVITAGGSEKLALQP